MIKRLALYVVLYKKNEIENSVEHNKMDLLSVIVFWNPVKITLNAHFSLVVEAFPCV